MNGVLFVHQNFPGQFPHIAQALIARGETCFAIGSKTAKNLSGVELERWSSSRGTTPGILKAATRAEADLIRGEAAVQAARRMKARGIYPRLIIGHPGWGETLFLKEVWPEAKQILLAEFFYRPEGADVGFDPQFGPVDDATADQIVAKNMGTALAFTQADHIVAPTPFQASLIPEVFLARTTILHEGVDVSRAKRRPEFRLRVTDTVELDGSKPIITFVNRSLEPLRGFNVFMQALPKVLEAVPTARAVIVGSATHSPYGNRAPNGKTWKDVVLEDVGPKLDISRVHFTGQIEHRALVAVLSHSWAHVYFTYPFVLSWSLVEAMACECLIVGSDTAPVRDAIEDGVNGVLCDFFDRDGLSDKLIEACTHPERFKSLRVAARKSALAKFDRATVGVPGWLRLIDDVAPIGARA